MKIWFQCEKCAKLHVDPDRANKCDHAFEKRVEALAHGCVAYAAPEARAQFGHAFVLFAKAVLEAQAQ